MDPGGDGTKAVLGPGSGLGMATLVPVSGRWLVLPSEGGHCDLPGTDPLEAEVVAALREDRDEVPWEACLSGPGLVALYKALGGGWQLRTGDGFVDEDVLRQMRERTDWGELLEPGGTEPPAEPGGTFRRPDW